MFVGQYKLNPVKLGTAQIFLSFFCSRSRGLLILHEDNTRWTAISQRHSFSSSSKTHCLLVHAWGDVVVRQADEYHDPF